jgi:cellulose synthase/poly-beta-1,6-N-acetylglucosamine synthase-like glycosyltransferase
MLDLGHLALIGGSLVLTAQSAYSAALMLYAWEDEEKQSRNSAPTTFEPPQLRFTILLPARHEEAVIQETIQRVVDLNYPPELVQALVVIEAGDVGTIAKVNEKLAALQEQGIKHVRLITFSELPINKPHGLNIGLQNAIGDVVTIFDAEDEPHPDILHLVNTVMLREKAPVVQCGVQLMNYADRWFSALNVLEYFFWFKSRLHYHCKVGMVPLGGNTIFIERNLIERKMGGWDQYCLTEDAEVGMRLSASRVPIRVVYDDRYVTKEETPPSVSQFIKQRTRWNQGFLQVLAKPAWRKLPTLKQRLLAFYTLAFSLFQALMLLYLPVSLWMMFFEKVPTAVALISSLPLYLLVLQFAITLVGLYEFTSVHKLRPSLFSPIKLALAYMPYQWLLSFAALRAVFRQLRGLNNWEKTAHVGAHRQSVPAAQSTPAFKPARPKNPVGTLAREQAARLFYNGNGKEIIHD